MKWTVLISLTFLIKSPAVFSQVINPAFLGKKKVIDSLVLSIDKNSSALVTQVIGVDSLFDGYKGFIYYTISVNKPDKINYELRLTR